MNMTDQPPASAFDPLRHFRLVAVAWLLLALTAMAQGQDLSTSVQLRLEMFVVTEVEGQEQFTASITAREGQTVEYRIMAINHSTAALQAGTVTITVPIPGDTTFQQGSAVPISEDVLVEYRSGESEFMSPPVFIEVDGTRQIANASEYDGIRWTLLDTMQPGEERQFSFRVTVN